MVARHPNTLQAILVNAVSEPELCRFVAANPSALAVDTSPNVRLAVAYNPGTPYSVLEKLSVDAEVEVRRAIASNIKNPGHVLEVLGHDWQCCIFVAQNLNASVKVLEYLAILTGFN